VFPLLTNPHSFLFTVFFPTSGGEVLKGGILAEVLITFFGIGSIVEVFGTEFKGSSTRPQEISIYFLNCFNIFGLTFLLYWFKLSAGYGYSPLIYRLFEAEITVESFCSTCDESSSLLELDSILRLPVSRSISESVENFL